ncbi:HDOD domain-containing protein [Oxalobacter sp. OttesenSCG-928-P03]|nr:HDOD domain-containing protein [Oxalobacter sp. OttesenSCG-928-P03]
MSALKTEILSRLSTARLPSLPHVLIRLMALCQSDNTTISDLANLIEQEPAIAHKILQVASSPAYRHLGQQTRLDQGLITLGTHLVRMLIINESVYQNFNYLPVFRDHDLRFFWRHSLKTAVIARKAAWHMGHANIDEAYLAGLLHDIGRLALLVVVPDLYHNLFYLPDTEELCEQERAVLGIDHAEAGTWLIRQWKFDPAFIDSVASHHAAAQPHALPGRLTQLVHMANRLAECNPDDPAIELIARNYQFSSQIAMQIVAEADKDFREAASHLGMDLSNIETVTPKAPPVPLSPVQQQLNQELSNLIQASELGHFFQKSKTLSDLQDAALKAASALFSLKSAILLCRGDEKDACRIVAVNKALDQLLGHSVSAPSEGSIARACAEMLPEFIESMDGFSLTPEKNMARLLGGESWILLPLAGNNQCPGLIFASIAKEKLEELRIDKYRLIYFGQQFISAWQHIQEVKKTIQDKVALAEEKHRRLSREMAHEINNPLAVIRNYLFVLNKQLGEEKKGKQVISILNEEIDRLGTLVDEMGNPAYSTTAQTQITDIKALVKEVVGLFHETEFIPDNIQLITHASSLLPENMQVYAPENLLKQVLVNLVKNAVEAMPDGGSIIITHKGLHEQDGQKYYALAVRDSGPGIPEEILKNLFQPATTAKGKDHHGLGLSIVYSLLNKIEAIISCQSDSSGTTFDLLLPAVAAEKSKTVTTL